MITKTVATKLNDDEHSKLIAECNRLGVTPSAFLRESIIDKIDSIEKPKESTDEKVSVKKEISQMSLSELAEKLGVKYTPKDKSPKIELERPKHTLEETLDHMKNCRNLNCKYGRKNLGLDLV